MKNARELFGIQKHGRARIKIPKRKIKERFFARLPLYFEGRKSVRHRIRELGKRGLERTQHHGGALLGFCGRDEPDICLKQGL